MSQSLIILSPVCVIYVCSGDRVSQWMAAFSKLPVPCFCGDCRTMWQRVLDISKRVIEERSALQQAAHIAESLQDLVNVLAEPESKRLQPAEAAKRIALCARCHDLLAACKASQDPAAPEHVTKLEGLLSKLGSLLKDSYQDAGAFDQLMFCMWKAGDSVAAAMPDPAGPTAEQVLKDQIIAGSSHCPFFTIEPLAIGFNSAEPRT